MTMRSLVLRSRSLALACLTAVAIGMAVPASVAAANPPITFDVYIGDSMIIVLNTGDAPTNVRLRDKDGNTKAIGVLADDDPFFQLPAGVTVEIGDRIRASDGTYTRKFVVPDLTISVDRVNDMFEGTGPAQRTIKVGWVQGRFGDVFESHGVRVRPDGTWSYEARFDVVGGLNVAVDWKTPNGDRVHTGGSAEVLIVTLGSARFAGNSGTPFADVEVLIDGVRDGGWTGQSGEFGGFSGRFRRANGNLIQVAPGDHISAPGIASDLDWVVPDVQISADAETDMVTGQCAGSFAVVELYRTGHRRGFAVVQPGPNDEFEFDFQEVGHFFANPANVKHGDSLRIECVLETGDSVLLRTIVP